MWPKYASARDFLHNAEEGKILHGKVIKNPRGDNLFIITPGRVSFPENPLT
jgi:hypothetical protein